MRIFDLISMGRTIVDVYGNQVGCGLEETSSFSKYVGGCPANVAIGTARNVRVLQYALPQGYRTLTGRLALWGECEPAEAMTVRVFGDGALLATMRYPPDLTLRVPVAGIRVLRLEVESGGRMWPGCAKAFADGRLLP